MYLFVLYTVKQLSIFFAAFGSLRPTIASYGYANESNDDKSLTSDYGHNSVMLLCDRECYFLHHPLSFITLQQPLKIIQHVKSRHDRLLITN